MPELTTAEIMQLLPHRYPFLFVDKITDYIINDDTKNITGIKNVTINEPFFQGHFPNSPIMPGVLILEGMAQVSGILGCLMTDRALTGFVVGSDKVRWRKPVVPGDIITYKAEFIKVKRSIAKFIVTASVSENTVANAELMIAQQ